MENEFRNVSGPGQTWRYFERGHGHPVVLLHGFPDTPHSWTNIATAVANRGYRAIVPYLRGYHPATFVDGRDYSAAHLGADITGLLDALDLDQAVLVGHDWGASATYRAVAVTPERVRGVVPIAVPHPAAATPSLQLVWEVRHFFYFKLPGSDSLTRRRHLGYIDTLFARWAPGWEGPERDAALADVKAQFGDPAVLHHALQYYRDLSLRPDPINRFRVGCPALLVAGGADFAVDAHHRSVSRCDGPVELLVVDGAGHWPHREDERGFTTALLTLLETAHR